MAQVASALLSRRAALRRDAARDGDDSDGVGARLAGPGALRRRDLLGRERLRDRVRAHALAALQGPAGPGRHRHVALPARKERLRHAARGDARALGGALRRFLPAARGAAPAGRETHLARRDEPHEGGDAKGPRQAPEDLGRAHGQDRPRDIEGDGKVAGEADAHPAEQKRTGEVRNGRAGVHRTCPHLPHARPQGARLRVEGQRVLAGRHAELPPASSAVEARTADARRHGRARMVRERAPLRLYP